MTKIELYKQVNEGIQCLVCPHFCVLTENQTGKCKVRKNKNNKIELINYGLISAMAVDPIKKKPFKHFLQDSKTFCISLSSHCNLSCLWCENHKLSQSNNLEGKYFSPENIVKDALEKHCKSVSMSYNEPTISYEYLIDLANECHNNGLFFILKTNAFINKEPWYHICQVANAMNIDWKGSKKAFTSITGCNQYVLEDRIYEAYDEGTHIEISIPLYYSDDIFDEEIENVGKFLSSVDDSIPCHLLRISSSYKYSDFIFNESNLDRAKNILSKYMNNIYFVI